MFHNLKNYRIEITVPKLPYKVEIQVRNKNSLLQRCKSERILQDVQHPVTGASIPLPVRGLKWHVLKRQRSS